MALGAGLLAAATQCSYPNFTFSDTGGAGGGDGGMSSSSSGGPSCASVDGTYGCCSQPDVVSFCNDGKTVMTLQCTLGTVCGWDPNNNYYNCGLSADMDPGHPYACGM